ncbi:DUF4362 domain-containing protein [Bacillus infantis]|uniref:DUF4362 domain-containing protein n=1 Tax=Bacillus infantis TaxID=324767 RepID=UPI002155EFC7|nr:DUF4362 domain-containing protein [Bacillus infantis]MCR6611386.1 DUF4362 domain-containing protein [Bacillus infantis]
MKKLFPLYILLPLLLMACRIQEEPAAELPDYKPSKDDIVSMHGDIENLERFLSFITNIHQGSEDTIRVVSYTEEGAPILHELEYDGQVIHSILDTRRDGFGQRMIKERECKSVDIEKGEERTNYALTDCGWNKDDYSILTIHK